MIVFYQNELWQYDCPVRESLFKEFQNSNPDKKIILTKGTRVKQALLIDVFQYSVWRHII